MGKKKKSPSHDPARLPPFDERELLTVIVETPKGSRNKYAYEPEQGLFLLKKVLPAGMAFPYDFGFVPSTRGGDGDPLDVLVLMDEPAFPGCRLCCRLIGVIEGEQRELKGKKKPIRNDRLVAVEQANHSFARVQRLDELGNHMLDEIAAFFTNYHCLDGHEFKVLATKGPGAARRVVEAGRTQGK